MSQSLLCCHPEHILSRKMERKQRHHSECFIFFPLISRVIPTPDSHLLLYTSPLTATPKLLVTYMMRDRFSFALQIHKHRFRLFSEVQPPPESSIVLCQWRTALAPSTHSASPSSHSNTTAHYSVATGQGSFQRMTLELCHPQRITSV